MAKIYISYNHSDREFVLALSGKLKEAGHKITVDVDALSPGMDWRLSLSEGLMDSDVFIALISKNSLESQHVFSEIGTARAFSQSTERMLMVPVIIDEMTIPSAIADINCIIAPDRNLEVIHSIIEKGIAAWIGRRTAYEEKKGQVSKRIEVNAAKYIDDAIGSLESFEKRNRIYSNLWYLTGFLSLLAGIGFAVFAVTTSTESLKLGLVDLGVIALKSIVVVGLLGACAKYAFSLGKSYISEALKSSDRLHAISFGRFYLQVYGTDVEWSELKDAFQHWNIDRESSFSHQNISDIDPKIVDVLVELVKSLSSGKNNANKT